MRTIHRAALTLGAALLAAPASAAILVFESPLGPEVPGATGSGFVTVTFDTGLHQLGIIANWSGLSGTTTVAHIHCCTATPNTGIVGVAVTPVTLPGFPTGLTAGNYAVTLDLTESSTYTASFRNNFGGGTVAGAEAALLAGLQQQIAYFNIHTTTFPGGEIRAFPAYVPEPESWALLLLGFGVLGGAMRARSRIERRQAAAQS
jgi:hypothetical protein